MKLTGVACLLYALDDRSLLHPFPLTYENSQVGDGQLKQTNFVFPFRKSLHGSSFVVIPVDYPRTLQLQRTLCLRQSAICDKYIHLVKEFIFKIDLVFCSSWGLGKLFSFSVVRNRSWF